MSSSSTIIAPGNHKVLVLTLQQVLVLTLQQVLVLTLQQVLILTLQLLQTEGV